jgi:hypothetical protein
MSIPHPPWSMTNAWDAKDNIAEAINQGTENNRTCVNFGEKIYWQLGKKYTPYISNNITSQKFKNYVECDFFDLWHYVTYI